MSVCGCPESEIVWGLLTGELPAPDTPGWRAFFDLVDAAALNKLAAIRPILIRADWDAIIPNRYLQLEVLRNTFEVPAWARSSNAILAARRRGEAA